MFPIQLELQDFCSPLKLLEDIMVHLSHPKSAEQSPHENLYHVGTLQSVVIWSHILVVPFDRQTPE